MSRYIHSILHAVGAVVLVATVMAGGTLIFLSLPEDGDAVLGRPVLVGNAFLASGRSRLSPWS